MQIPRLVPRPVKAGRQAEGSAGRVSVWLVKRAALSCEGVGGEAHSSVAQVIENEPLPRTYVIHVEDWSQVALMYLELVPSLSYTGCSRCLCVTGQPVLVWAWSLEKGPESSLPRTHPGQCCPILCRI